MIYGRFRSIVVSLYTQQCICRLIRQETNRRLCSVTPQFTAIRWCVQKIPVAVRMPTTALLSPNNRLPIVTAPKPTRKSCGLTTTLPTQSKEKKNNCVHSFRRLRLLPHLQSRLWGALRGLHLSRHDGH